MLAVGALGVMAPLGLDAGATEGGSSAATLDIVASTQGFMVGGTLSDLTSSDDSYVEIAAVLDGSKYVTTTLIAGSTTPGASCLDLMVEAGADTDQPTRFVVFMLDHSSSRWKRAGSFRTSEDSMNLFADVHNPDSFIDPASGMIWVMVETSVPKSKAPNGYTVRLDLVEMGVTE